MTLTVHEDVSLSAKTTLEVGGSARFYTEASSASEAVEAVRFATDNNLPIHVLGGGSNLLVADRGVAGLVLRLTSSNIDVVSEETIDVDAGVRWDELVAWTVARDLAGLECLSGIPGDVGAAPIQNIGAYGQELAESLVHVDVIDHHCGEASRMTKDACELGYRDSLFKRAVENRFIVTGVRLRLQPHGRPKIAYAELERAMTDAPQTLATVRDMIISLRRRKSMVLDPHDENRRSAGSFFVNPTVDPAELDAILSHANRLAPDQTMPQYPAAHGRIKLSAAWLIERAGLVKGTAHGRVGISTRHSLGIVNRGGATASDIVRFALHVKQTVHRAFGVTLHPEPRMVGFEPEEIRALVG